MRVLFAAMTLALAWGCATASAQDWPRAPIKIIVPVGPGLATDLTARLFADSAATGLGVGVVVENVTGGSGVLGAQMVARAAPDGYTLFFSNSSALTSNMYLLKNINYDPRRDFDAVAMVSDSSPFLIAVNKDLPVRSLADLIALGKSKPGALSLGIDATSGFGLITGRLLNKRGGVGMEEVAYRATPQMMQDAISGRIQALIAAPVPLKPFTTSGQLRALAVSSKDRFPGIDLPTMAETIPGLVVDGWFALMAPAGTPAAVKERLNGEVAKFLGRQDIRQRLAGLGVLLSTPKTVETASTFLHQQEDDWAGIAKELDLTPQ